MPDHNLFSQLKNHAIDAAQFDHSAHVRSAWDCLNTESADPASAYAQALWGLICRAEAKAKYHATLTGAFLNLIASEHVPGETWATFAARNEDLMKRPKALIGRHYSPERLQLEAARTWFLAPDRIPLPACHFPLHGVEVAQLEPGAVPPAPVPSGGNERH
ncbi:MAG: hypothetical protein AAGA23_19675 [Pseudomonadota bacterium]